MWYGEVRSRGLQRVAIVEPHCYITRPKGYLKPLFSVPRPWVTLAPTITHACEPSRIGYWHVVSRQMLRCELNVTNTLLYTSLAYRIISSPSTNLQPGLITIVLGLGLAVLIVELGKHRSQRLSRSHHAVGAAPHRALSCIAQL